MDQVIFDSDFFFFKFQNQVTFVLILLLSAILQIFPIFGHMFRIFPKKQRFPNFSKFTLLPHCQNAPQEKTVPGTCSSLKIQRTAQH
jgi:hypothetical protein